jgi:two-component system, NtrC family, response regulator AtoC
VSLKILLVDDKEYELDPLALLLRTEDHEVATFVRPAEALAHLEREPVDVVVTDLNMPGMSGIELTEAALSLYPDLDVIVVTAFGSIDTAVEAMRLGAAHYLVKSPRLGDELLLALQRIDRQRTMRRHMEELEGAVGAEERLAGLVGRSPEMLEVFRLVRSVAPHDTTVLIRGETGTGKDLVAKAVHTLSQRCDEPYVAVNCAALPESLIESELFGHVRGAFTGATGSRDGKVKAAGRGTLLLDEIGDLPLQAQPKLLRLLEDGTYSPVGGQAEISSSARVIAATNRDIESMVEEGTFRLDLFHRLNVITVPVAPLRQRRSDIPLLAEFLVRRVAQRLGLGSRAVAPQAMQAMLRCDWPGNGRQLEHALERALVVGQGDAVQLQDLPPEVTAARAVEGGAASDALLANERALIARVLSETGWNIHEASRRLEISRPTLYSKIKKHNLSRDD